MKTKTIKAWAVYHPLQKKIAELNGIEGGMYLISKKRDFFSKKDLSNYTEIVPCEIKILR